MRKFLIISCSVIIAVVLIVVIAWTSLPSWLSSALSKRAKVPVTIESVHLLSPGIEFNHIRIGNPPGSVLPHALHVGKLGVHTPLTRFFDNRIVIDLMTMDDVFLALEFESTRSTRGNWSTIMGNLKQSTGKEREKEQKKGKSSSVLIKKLIITNLNIDLVYQTGDRRIRKLRPIKRLELNNISSEGGLPTAQIMDIIMSEMLRNVFSTEGLKNMLDGVLSPEADSVKSPIKGLFSKSIEQSNGTDLLYEPIVKIYLENKDAEKQTANTTES